MKRILSHLIAPLTTLLSLGPVITLLIVVTWVKLGQSWAYKFWRVSLTLDADTDHDSLSAALIEADPPVAASYLEARISTDLVVQVLRSCIS